MASVLNYNQAKITLWMLVFMISNLHVWSQIGFLSSNLSYFDSTSKAVNDADTTLLGFSSGRLIQIADFNSEKVLSNITFLHDECQYSLVFYQNTSLLYSISYKSPLDERSYSLTYNYDGSLACTEIRLANNERFHKCYFENGKLESEAHYSESDRVINRTEYYENGMPSQVVKMNRRGNGYQKFFNENGLLIESAKFRKFLMNGEHKFFDDKGELKSVIKMKNGQIIG